MYFKKNIIKLILQLVIIQLIAVCFLNKNMLFAELEDSMDIYTSTNPIGSGARAVGMGGAFIAIADDATAASWNPAGLIQLEKPEISFVSAFENTKQKYYSENGDQTDISSSGVDNFTTRLADFNINYFSATYPAYFHRNIVFSINYQRLYEFKRNYTYYRNSEISVGGNTINNSKKISAKENGHIGALGLAFALEITPKISFGTTINIWTDKLLWENEWKIVYHENSYATRDADYKEGYTGSELETYLISKYSSYSGINANFGILWNVNNHLAIGAVLKAPFTSSCRKKSIGSSIYKEDIESINSQIVIDQRFHQKMPGSYGLGASYRFSDTMTIGMDIYVTKWSKYILTDESGFKYLLNGQPKGEVPDFKDTTQIRIGGEYLIIKQNLNIAIPIRAGLFYDPEPYNIKKNKFYGIALGSGIAYKRFILDFAYQLRWGKDIDANNIIPASENDSLRHTILSSVIIHF